MISAALLLVVVLAVAALPCALRFLGGFSSRRKSEGVPPGGMGWPVFGETFAFLKPHNSNSVGAFLERRCSRYGTVFKSHLFGSPAIVSCDLDLNNFILQNEGRLFQSSYPKAMHSILGETSLLLVTGTLHRKIRSIVTSFIGASKSSPDFHASIQEQSLKLLNEWEEQKEIAFLKESKRFAFNLTVKLFMSIEPEDPLTKTMMEDFLTFMQGFISFPISLPGTTFSKALKARRRLFSSVRSIIRKREIQEQEARKGDYVDLVLAKDLTEDERVTSVLDMLLGSHETTATLMALILYFLENATPVLQALKDEHRGIRDKKRDDELLNSEDYQQMEFTQCVIWEALRLGNVVKFVHRKAITDVKYKDYLIPSGWKVLPIFTVTHLDPSMQDNPTVFNPWRWMINDMVKRVTPFGGGLRLCPGGDIARVEISFFLHYILLDYGWKSKGDEQPLAFPFVEFQKGLLLEIYGTK